MADENLATETYFGKCKCCLKFGYLRTMWEKHIVQEETEIYGQMLMQCFEIPWTIQTTEEDDQICQDCIWKLREAYLFKKQVLQCLNKELEHCDFQLNKVSESDDENYVVEYLEDNVLDSDQENTGDEGKKSAGRESPVGAESQDDASQNDVKCEELQFEEEDSIPGDPTKTMVKRRPRLPLPCDSDNPPKWPRKLPKEQRYKTYKQYTQEALKRAVIAVLSEGLSQTKASIRYEVPKKTLSAKVRDFKNNKTVFPQKSSRPLVKDLEIVLKHVNVTPFRCCRANNTLCFYCSEKCSSPDDLRTHSASQHSNPTLKTLESSLQPWYYNEVVKFDIKDVSCKVCNLAILNWAETLQHIEYFHGLTLESKNKMIPFNLDYNSCVLCSQEFSSYMMLHAHMNKHFNNYVCGSCGESFVSSIRLKIHMRTHNTGSFPCPICNKVFTLDKYMKKHAITHTEEKRVKCNYCDQMFRTEYHKRVHYKQSHKEHLESITCELCGSSFIWLRQFLRHMKYKHNTKYQCDQCSKFYYSKADLKEHLTKHGAKEYKCMVCSKKFFAQTSLNTHIKSSHKGIKV